MPRSRFYSVEFKYIFQSAKDQEVLEQKLIKVFDNVANVISKHGIVMDEASEFYLEEDSMYDAFLGDEADEVNE